MVIKFTQLLAEKSLSSREMHPGTLAKAAAAVPLSHREQQMAPTIHPENL